MNTTSIAGFSFSKFVAVIAMLVLSWCPPMCQASEVVNFDSLDTTSGSVSGVPLTNYLAGFGITVSDVTPGTTLTVENLSVSMFVPQTPPNALHQQNNANGESYTLNFSPALSSLSFTRCAELPGPDGIAYPYWSATAYDGSLQIGQVSEDAYSLWPYNGSKPAHTYAFTGSHITSLVVYGNAYNFAACSTLMIDDIVLTPTPEPATLSLLALGALAMLRRRMRG